MARKSQATEIALLKSEMRSVKSTQRSMCNDMKEIKKAQEDMLLTMTKHKGFWGAVTLIGSALWAAVAMFKDNVMALMFPTAPK
jgi:hypothetical protein